MSKGNSVSMSVVESYLCSNTTLIDCGKWAPQSLKYFANLNSICKELNASMSTMINFVIKVHQQKSFRNDPPKQRPKDGIHGKGRNATIHPTIDCKWRTMEVNEDGCSWKWKDRKDNPLASI